MPKQSLNTLKSWFKKGLKPLETQFADWLDSYFHKDESIPINNVQGLSDILNSLPSSVALESIVHLIKIRGVVIANNAVELQQQSGSNTFLVLVKEVGLFAFEAQGEIDGKRIFPATDGGVWKIALGVDRFDADFTVTLSGGKTFGRFLNGQLVPANGKSPVEVMLDAAIEYLVPAFTSFLINGQNATIEVGASILGGDKTFQWSISNTNNVTESTVTIRDQSGDTTLIANTNNDGAHVFNLPVAIQLAEEGNTQIFRIQAQNSKGILFLRDFTVTADYVRRHGAPDTIPANSGDVRALAGATFGNTFSINIPLGKTIIVFAYEATRPDISDSSVKYVEGFNSNVGNTFIKSVFNVDDAGGTPRSYKVYVAQLGAPYSSPATYNVTIP